MAAHVNHHAAPCKGGTVGHGAAGYSAPGNKLIKRLSGSHKTFMPLGCDEYAVGTYLQTVCFGRGQRFVELVTHITMG